LLAALFGQDRDQRSQVTAVDDPHPLDLRTHARARSVTPVPCTPTRGW
jgi:hypothetical protein